MEEQEVKGICTVVWVQPLKNIKLKCTKDALFYVLYQLVQIISV